MYEVFMDSIINSPPPPIPQPRVFLSFNDYKGRNIDRKQPHAHFKTTPDTSSLIYNTCYCFMELRYFIDAETFLCVELKGKYNNMHIYWKDDEA
jgi:hypothetical protein